MTLAIALSTLLAGFLADAVAPSAAVWTMVALLALAGAAWYAFSGPAVAEDLAGPAPLEDR